jgi:hypothetical protein
MRVGTGRGGELVPDEAQSWYRMKLVPEEAERWYSDEAQSWYQMELVKRCRDGTRRGAKMVPDGAGTRRGVELVPDERRGSTGSLQSTGLGGVLVPDQLVVAVPDQRKYRMR